MGGGQVEAELHEAAGHVETGRLVPVGEGEEDRPLPRQVGPGGGLGLGERPPERGVDPHHLARRAHLRTEEGVGVGEAVEGQDGLLDAHVAAGDRRAQEPLGPQLGQGGAGDDPGRDFGQGDAGGLGDEGDRPRGPWVGLDDVDLRLSALRTEPLDGVLDVDRPDDLEGVGDGPGVDLDGPDRGRVEGRGRDDAGAVAGVHAGLLDVLHDGADDDLAGAVPYGVHVDLDGVLQEAVDQHGPLRRQAALPAEGAGPGQLRHGPAQVVVVVDDLHGPARRARSSAGPGRGSRSGP